MAWRLAGMHKMLLSHCGEEIVMLCADWSQSHHITFGWPFYGLLYVMF
jgi:hypothetical protein